MSDRVEDLLLGEPMTLGYRPQLPILALHDVGDVPLPMMLRDVEAMQLHPYVEMCLSQYKSGIAQAKWKVRASSSKVGAWADAMLRRFWDNCLEQVQHGYDYGWGGFENVWTIRSGLWWHDGLIDFSPLDTTVLTRKGKYVGIRVKGTPGGPTDLWGPRPGGRAWGRDARGRAAGARVEDGVWPAKAFWYAHRRRYSQWYGRTQLYAAWRPWRRLAGRDGAEQVVDMGFYRFAYRGPVGRYPPEDKMPPGSTQDASRRTARDKMRELVEAAKAGVSVALPSTKYPPEMGGDYKWLLDWPDHTLSVEGLLGYPEYLKGQIAYGVGVPPELIEASEVGSGWSGRRIPLVAYFTGQQKNAQAIVRSWWVQIAMPACRWNFGPGAWFEVELEPLIPPDQQGQTPGGQPPAAPDQQGGAAPPTQPQPQSGQQPKYGSLSLVRFGPEDDDEVLRALLLAMLDAQADGDEDEAEALLSLAEGDGLEELLAHLAGDEDEPKRAQLATTGDWQPYIGKRGPRKGQQVGWVKNGRVVYGTSKPGGKRQAGKASAAEAEKLLARVLTSGQMLTPEHLTELGGHLSALPVGRLRDIRSKLGISFGGGRKRNDMVAAIRRFASGEPGPQRKAEKEINPAAEDHRQHQANEERLRIEKKYGRGLDEEDYRQAQFNERLQKDQRDAVTPRPPSPEVWRQMRANEERLVIEQKYGKGLDEESYRQARVNEERLRIEQKYGKGLSEEDYRQARANEARLDEERRLSYAGERGRQPERSQAITPQRKQALIDRAIDWLVRRGLLEEEGAPFKASLLRFGPAEDDTAAAIRALARRVRREVLASVRPGLASETIGRLRRILARYHAELVRHLTDQQLLEALRAMRRVVEGLPGTPPMPGSGETPVAPPADSWSPAPIPGDDPDAVRLPLIEEAVRDLRSRTPLTRAVFDRLDAEARERAFTLAGTESEAVVGKVRDLLADVVEDGPSLREFRQRVRDEGLEGTFLSPWHVENVFRTNTQEAFSRGQEAILDHPVVGDAFPYAAYESVHDDRRRPEHGWFDTGGLDGTNVFRRDDPTFVRFRPPWDYACRCSWIPLTIAMAARRGVKEAQRWLETGLPPASPEWVEPPPFDPPPGFGRATFGPGDEWVRYEGPEGGKGWKNTRTGKIVYGDRRPGRSYYHGPTAPGPEWRQAGTDPVRGNIYHREHDAPKPGLLERVVSWFKGKSQQPAESQEPTEEVKSTETKHLIERMRSSEAYQERAKEVNRKQSGQYEHLANQTGVSVEELKKQATAKIQKIVDSCDIYRRVSLNMKRMFDSGRFKNQHETGFGGKGGVYAPEFRTECEDAGMGVDAGTHVASKPIYGYFSEPDFAGWEADNDDENGSKMNRYQPTVVRFKPHVKERSTVSLGDSLESIGGQWAQATPAGMVGPQTADPSFLIKHGIDSFDSLDKYRRNTKSFIECQMHDGISVDDIAEIGFAEEPDAELQSLLAKYEVKWRVLKSKK